MEHLISPLITVPNEILYLIVKDLKKREILSLLQTNSTFHLPLRSLLISKYKNDVLHYAAWSDNLDLLRLALFAGADVSCSKVSLYDYSNRRNNALHRAVRRGNTAIIAELLLHNPPLEKRDEYSNTPLLSAAAYGHQAVVDLLLTAGCNSAAHGYHGQTLFETAVISGLESTAVKFIGQATESSLIIAFESKRLGLARLIKRSGVAFAPFISQAAEAGIEYVKLCLADGARINDVNHDTKCTALSIAARKGDIELVKFLLTKGANPNAGPRKNRPIMTAVRYGMTRVVRCLLKHGVDLTCLKNPPANVLLVACALSPPAIVEMLLDAGQGLEINGNPEDQRKPAPLHVAAKTSNCAVIKLLLKRGVKRNASRGPKEETALHWAARGGKFMAVEALIEGGVDATLRCGGYTALKVANHSSASPSDKAMTMAALVRGGADITELGKHSRIIVTRQLLRDGEE